MLRLLADYGDRSCDGLARRDFLQAGALSLGGLTLPWLFEQQAALAETVGESSLGRTSFVRDKSIVLLFLSGGASHVETFNPNMDAPSPYCSMTGDVATSLPGVAFGGTFPMLAKHAHEMAVVRSFQHSLTGHVEAIVHVLTGGTDPAGKRKTGFSMGSACSRLMGANHPRTGMPSFALLNTDEVDPQYRNERTRVENGSEPNSLGAAYRPFTPSGKSDAVRNMTLQIPRDRLDDRRELRAALDRLRQEADQDQTLVGTDRFTQQAFDVILGSAAEAFDLSREDRRLVERYETSHIQVGKKSFRPSLLGQHMLTARRLVESGCQFVTVHSAGWDMHADGNNPGIVAGMEMLGRSVDQAVSAFLEDVAARRLSEKILLIITGDFGRTPKINKSGGRDHWSNLSTLAFAGGGLKMGQVIGQAARKNDVPLSEPITTSHLLGTVLHTLFDVAALRLARGVPREVMSLVEQSEPIPGLAAR